MAAKGQYRPDMRIGHHADHSYKVGVALRGALEHAVAVGLVCDALHNATEAIKRFLFHLIASVCIVLLYHSTIESLFIGKVK